MMVTRRRASPRRGSMVDSRTHLHSFFPGHLVILLFSIIIPVLGTPISYFPLNSQLPPVARVSEPFSFVFSPLTFSSDADEMSYALGDGSPSWLSLDSASRTLSGTPDEATIPSDETLVGIVITLIASDDTGSMDVNATLVVSRSPKPVVRIPLVDQIKKFGVYSAPSSILLHPSSEFEFEFDPNTFGPGVAKLRDGQGGANGDKGNSKAVKRDVDGTMSGTELPQLSYYAVSGNNAPLPSWVAFDPKRLAFSGKTPLSAAIAQPPQKFDFQLVASDVVGFSSAAIEFSIILGNHELMSKEPIILLNATKGKQFEYTDLPSILQLDEKPLKAEDVSSIKADGLPPWLSFNEESWKISGTPDMEAQPTNVTIVVVDSFLDALNITLAIEFNETIFMSNLPSLNVSAGEDFSLDLQKFLSTPNDTQLVAKIQPDNSWIQFDESSMILSGTVPKPPDAKLADDVQISFDATQIHTNIKETKDMIIHVNKSAVDLSPTPEPPPTKAPTKEYDSRRDLYWLLVIPALVIAVAIILWIFMVRRRRNQPKKLDFSEVSGPVPGTFVANGYMDPSLDEVRRMVDTGPQAPYVGPYSPPGASNLKKSLSKMKPKIQVDQITPPGMAKKSRTIKPVHQGKGNGESWLGGRPSRPSPVGTDEVSLLSSNSSCSRVIHDAKNLFVKKLRPGDKVPKKKIGLEVPEVPEPFSIQPTPDLAYRVAGKYDYVSDEDTQPSVGSSERQRPAHPQNTSLAHQGAGNRLSQAWKRMSISKAEDTKRNSQHSASTDATTCTSILTSGVTEEATTASANVVAKPTIIHIGGRPGEARQLSRRTGGSTTFFAGGSITKSQRNFGLDKDTMSGSVYSSATPKEQGVARDTKTTWDHQTTSPLGISYRNLIPQKRGDTWNTDITDEELLSPSRWPKPAVTPGQAITSDVLLGPSKPAQPPPFKLPNKAESPGTPMGKGKKRSSPMRRLSRIRGSISSLSQTPPTHTRSKGRSSREERLRLSRIREQKALDEFRVMMSHTPSPHNEWAPSRVRPLPETPSRISKPPVAVDHANEPRGLKSTASKRSVKTLRSNKSVRSTRAYDDDDDDAWEDIPPPESVILGWEGGGSDGSFPVYI
ncbi:hypothetical protein F5B22DRAFT_513663 [Xylaria bambusicola]|uniref:uncharacterized protein n=1 Tax=Xylaria bambusicola TaxID=326684 RepID=UPI002007DF30|nr:uncharacterized protein F5B22DRAFT_513663 [Xylaria bambusicola]KAI0522011.1 hypothetical protein F5B22DRAFT_513663 [Xylaria bambusicola]